MSKHLFDALSKCARRAPGEGVTLTDAEIHALLAEQHMARQLYCALKEMVEACDDLDHRNAYKDEKAHAREVMEKARPAR